MVRVGICFTGKNCAKKENNHSAGPMKNSNMATYYTLSTEYFLYIWRTARTPERPDVYLVRDQKTCQVRKQMVGLYLAVHASHDIHPQIFPGDANMLMFNASTLMSIV